MYHEREAIINNMPVRMMDLIRKVRDEEIILPEDVKMWNILPNMNFVENILLDIQPQNLLFQVTEDGHWIVRYGFETIKSIYEYLVETDKHTNQPFPLRYEGICSTHFEDLKAIWYNRINEYVLKCKMISPSTEKETVEDLVERFCGKRV